MQENDLFQNKFDQKYGDLYRTEHSDPTNVEHALPGNTKDNNCGKSLKPRPTSNTPPQAVSEVNANISLDVFGHSVVDYVSTMLPNGAPEGSRHKFALKIASDAIILYDGDIGRVRALLLSIKWVQDIVTERGMDEIERILVAAQKRMAKREAENLNDPQPSREMRRAIEIVAGLKYSYLLKEVRNKAMNGGDDTQDDCLQVLEKIGRQLEKLAPHYPLLKLLCFRLKRKYYAAAFFIGGAFAMTLMTRCYYEFWPKPGRKCRLNSLLLLIGRMGGGKQLAVDLYRIMMEPIKKADAAQVKALNEWNREKDQNGGGAKNKSSRPDGIYRALPSETSTAALREAEANAHETIDGEEYYLHVSVFDSELQNTLSQLKKGYMDALLTYWLKSFHNEPHGAYLKTSSAPVGESDVHFNAVYTGTSDALNKLNTESNFVNGLDSRFTAVPNADSNFEMLQVHDYDDAAKKRDAELLEWAYKLDSTIGEIPCKKVSDALKDWTARRMADAKDNDDLAEEDLVKRPCWHAINYALPFIVTRHWGQMVRVDEKMKCGAGFEVDKTDVKLAQLIANAQLAFQEYFFKSVGEKHYDDEAAQKASNVRRQRKTKLAYNRLPNPFTSEDVKREYGYDNVGSVCSRLKHLQDDGLAKKIRAGEDKGKYRKLA